MSTREEQGLTATQYRIKPERSPVESYKSYWDTLTNSFDEGIGLKYFRKIKHIAPPAKVSAAGGINETYIAEYAATEADIIVLSSVYFGEPTGINVRTLPKK